MAKRKEPAIVWHEDGLIKIFPINSEMVYFTDYTDEMYQLLSGVRWKVDRGYLCGYVNGRNVYLHHLVLPREKSKLTDHINRKRNDNRGCNLRNVTPTENRFNCGLSKANTSGYKGVSWNIKNKSWMASLRVNGRSKNLGYFQNPQEAHEVFLEAAEKYYPGILYQENISLN